MLKPEYNDPEVLEKIAEAEVESRDSMWPFTGIGWEQIEDEFSPDEYSSPLWIMLPNRLKKLEQRGYLNQVSPTRSSTSATYELTQKGWNTVYISSPKKSKK